jgi:hypothetical protein
MKKIIGFIFNIVIWTVCVLIFPFSLMAFFFIPSRAAVCLAVFTALFFVFPLITKKKLRPSLRFSVLITEMLMVLIVLSYYTSDRRAAECYFEPDDHVIPLLTYSQCERQYKDTIQEKACLSVVDNPYDLASYRGRLLVVSGRDYSTLGSLNQDKPGAFMAAPLGFGNLQEIVIDDKRNRAVFTMWKDRKILLYDLEKSEPVKYFKTKVSKLIAAEKYDDKVFIVSELPWLYVLDLSRNSFNEYELGYRFHTLNGMRIDSARKAIYLTDWVWGKVYKIDIRTMKTVRSASPGMVSTGIALDSKKCEVYVSRMLMSKIDVFDCETLAFKRSIPAGFGVNEIALSRDGKKIYAVRYFAGKFRIIARATGKMLAEYHIGGQTRALLYLEEENRLFAGTKCGVYEIKINSQNRIH